MWDCIWTLGVATPVHFHDKDVVAVFLEDGDLKSTTLDRQSVVNPHTPGEVRFTPRNRTHTEVARQQMECIRNRQPSGNI